MAKSRRELPYLYYPRHDSVRVINAHRGGGVDPPPNVIAAYTAELDVLELVAKDQVGSNNGTLTNGATKVLSDSRLAYSFDGTNDYIGLSSWGFSGSVTFSLWVRPAGLLSNRSFLNARGVLLEKDGATINWYPNTATTVETTGNVLTANVWQHVALTQSGTAYAIYVNGVSVKSGTTVAINASVSVDASVGAYQGAVRFFSGLMDDIRIYDRALDASEVLYLATSRGIGY